MSDVMRLPALVCSLCLVLACNGVLGETDSDIPFGHLKPFGDHRPPSGEVERWPPQLAPPTPRQFFLNYVFESTPVVFEGMIKHTKAFHRWTDAYLRAHGEDPVIVELTKKEAKWVPPQSIPLKDVVDDYRHEDMYVCSVPPSELAGDIEMPSVLRCGGALNSLAMLLFWMSSGNTNSSFHNDNHDNIHCLVDGAKEFRLVPRHFQDTLETDEYGFDPGDDVGYHSFMRRMNADAVDMVKYPGYQNLPWYRARLKPGDCLFLPAFWYHYVKTPPRRNVCYNVWWSPITEFHPAQCSALSAPSAADFFYELHPDYSSRLQPVARDINTDTQCGPWDQNMRLNLCPRRYSV